MLTKDRERMVTTQIEARGITDPLVPVDRATVYWKRSA